MRANAFVAILICIAVFLAGCSADMNSTESDTDFKGAETTVQTNQNDTEQYTQDTEISDVINDTAFGDYGRLIFPVNSSYYSGDTLGEPGLTWYNNIDPDKTVEIANWRTMEARLNRLNELGIPTEFHHYEGLRHGFGLGTGTVAEGWINDAVNFWENQMQ